MATIIGVVVGTLVGSCGHLSQEDMFRSALIGILGLGAVWLEQIATQLKRMGK